MGPEPGELLRVEGDPDVRTAAWSIEECNFAHMFLDDFLDDREA